MKITAAIPAPPECAAADPRNHALVQELHNSTLRRAALQKKTLVAFPSLSPAEAIAIIQELDFVHELAFDLAGQVNRQQLASDAAAARLKRKFLRISSENLSRLLTRKLVDTR